ncbi:metallophosphoesterase [Larkinella soli]|uniref:metallophosphoesterase n=1 Tax=Larkinella soli TaxID=1770527 RepID=UPI000FFBB34B|nr:metallophosphoesterase [Larkinella soli]
MKHLYSFLFLLILLPAWGVAQTGGYTVFLLGDAGEPRPKDDPILKTLQTQLSRAGRNSSLIFLGDNVYESGLPDSAEIGRDEAEGRLREQLSLLERFPGRAFMIPGNHDWHKGGRLGWQRIKNQERFVSTVLRRDDVFFPKGGCPGPVEVSLNPGLTLILIDTQWWLHPWDKPGEESDCEAKDLSSFLLLLDDALERNRGRRVILAGHHPMFSHGSHGGHFVFRDHLFPLINKIDWLYFPLPVVGSIYPLYRSWIGSIQDIPNPKYKLLRNGIVALLKKNRNVLYVNGHDHNEQLILQDSTYYLTSGSGSKSTPVKKGRNSLFASREKGFARLDVCENGTVKISFITADESREEGRILDSLTIRLPANPPTDGRVGGTGPTRTVVPSRKYTAGSFHRFLLGDNYREVWESPVEVPVLNLRQQAGGLKPLQRGGGMQTLSLRLEGKDGHEYVLRSVEKYAENAIPMVLRSRFVGDIVQDQISASHPFAALAVPKLAEAAGIYHTNPMLVIVPDDSLLGPYRRVFANTLALFEERVDGDYRTSTSFGGTRKIYSTSKLLEKLADDNDNRVDQQAVLKARLFDLFLGDWDRHDDQWRWAGYKAGSGQVFRPVPRDRDQAFFVNEGLIPRIASRKWAMPKIQGFDYTIRDVPGLSFNARYFDRSFLTEPDRNDWLKTADSLKASLTDASIDEALRQLPSPAYEQTAATIKSRLQRRRTDLGRYADELYRFLARNVDVTGSDKAERFLVDRKPGGLTEVSVFKLKKDGDPGKRMYRRVFDPAETREVRLYGLSGNDEFLIGGRSERGSLIRIIGGIGEDRITDSSRVDGGRRTIIYDTRNTRVTPGPETRLRLSDRPDVNSYNRKAFRYDVVFPQVSVQYNPDDGLFLGGGVLYRKQGFRKEPYAQQHRFIVNHAFATSAYNFRYDGIFTDVLGKTDLRLNADLKAPNFVYNFFGLGNETVFDKRRGINYYRTRFENFALSALLQHQLGPARFFAGPALESIEVEENPRRFIGEYVTGLPEGPDLFRRRWYAGLRAGFEVDSRDSQVLPTKGLHWDTELVAYDGITALSRNLTRLQSDLSFYVSFRLPALLTFATRFGGGANFTNFEFFQANTLGGLSNLRGFRRTRFAGKSALYNNTELRLKVATIRTYLFPAYLGLLGFNDVGRVWVDGDGSRRWHQGFGGGIWLAPYSQAVVSLLYAVSEEDRIPMLRVGFLF